MKHSWKRIFALILAVVMTLSLLPTAALAAKSKSAARAGGVTIDVTDYGADPTGAKESSTAIREALKYAKTLDADVEKTIRFPKGEYHFYADYSEVRELYVSNTVGTNQTYKNKHLGILVEDLDNVTIDGGGSQFIYHGDITAFATIRSNNVKFQKFSVDHASPSVVDVTVESIEGQTATLYIPPCYTYTISGTDIKWEGERGPVTGTPYWTGNNNLGYRQGMNTIDGHTQRGTGGPFNGSGPYEPARTVTNIEQVPGDPTHIKVTYQDNLPVLGMCYQLRNTTRTTPGTFFWESDGVTLQDINIQFLHGFGMVGQLSKNITLDTVKFEARPGTGRTTAGFADFVQMSSVGGKVTIRNCEFSNPHDDPINIHGTFLEVTEVSNGNKTFKVQYKHGETAGFPQYYVGDKVDFSVKSSMAPVANSERTVMAVTNPGEGGNDLTTITITLDEPVNGITADNYVVENVTYTPEVLIENCRFVETPTRGILVTTRREVIIQNNYFDRMGMAAIYISCDASNWRESGRTENVTIRNNTFVVDPYTQAQAAIYVDPSGNGSAGNRIHKNMLIENNVFNMAGQSVNAIYAKSVNGLTIRNNIIQRYTPDVSMTLSGAQSVAVGGTQATTLTSSGSTYAPSTRMLRFDDCESVTLENNIYDDGLFVGIGGNSSSQLSGTDMALNGDQSLPAVGAVQYYSSDPTVATVDESGVVTGVSAGEAEIYAYRVAGARTFESNHLTFTVTGTAAAKPNKIEITADKDKVDVNGTVNLTATVDPTDAGSVAWAVKPAADGGAATITQAGVLTATAPGVVEVTASLGGVTASKLVTVNRLSMVYLSDLNWTSATTGDSWSSVPLKDLSWESEKDGRPVQPIKLIGEGGTELVYEKGIGTHAESIIKFDLTGKGYTTFTGRAGVSYYQYNNSSNTPNLHFAVLCDGVEQVTRDSVYNQAAPEAFSVNITGVQELTLKVTSNKTGNGAFWGAHGNWADTKLLCENAAPTVSGVTATANDTDGTVTVGYTYSDADNDAETGSVIAWYISDAQDGHYTRLENASAKTLTATAATKGKYVKAVVVPRDATGGCGAPVTSNAVQVPNPTSGGDDATLATLSVAGLTLSPAFDPATTEYTVSVPASAKKVTVSATATQGDAATVTGAGVVDLTGTETTATVTVTAPNGTPKKTYTVTINRAASSVATLSGLTASAGSASITYNAATRFYELIAGQTAQNLTFSATKADPNATVAVRYNAEEKGTYEEAPKTLPLMAGLNNLELRVTAEDGISTALYRVRVMRPASSEAELTALTVNGENVTIGDAADLGLVPVTGDTATLNATVSEGATVYLSVDGKAAENGASVTLAKTLSMVTVRVVAEDGVAENVYTLALSKPDPDNAQLYSLKLGNLALSPAFDPEVTEYTATDYGFAKAALAAVAAQGNATVTYETVADYKTDTGRITGDCRFFKDEGLVNKVTVTVTSPNGENTETYTITVDVVGSVYLSDLNWVTGSSGDTSWNSGIPQLDQSWESGKGSNGVRPIKLIGSDGSSAVEFEKGIGTHANSNIEYDLSAMGFTTFTAKVGVSHYQQGNTNPHLYFRVRLDGAEEYSSGEMQGTTPYKEVSVNLGSAKTLELNLTQPNNIYNAHGNWADAKLSSNIPLLSETTDVPIKYLEFEHHDEEEHVIYVNPDHADHTVNLHPIFKPAGVTDSAHIISLVWASDDTTVATVSEGKNKLGLVTAVALGRVKITATADNGATASCYVTVKDVLSGSVSIVKPTADEDYYFGSELSVALNQLTPQGAHAGLTYAWKQGNKTVGTGETYTPVEDDIGKALTVTVTAADPYEGSVTSAPVTVQKAPGLSLDVTPKGVACTTSDNNDGKITGLDPDTAYEISSDGGNNWDDADVTDEGVIEGLDAGSYLLRLAETDTHAAGVPSDPVTVAEHDDTLYEVKLETAEGGRVRTSSTAAEAGTPITLEVVPNTGYQMEENSLTVTGESGETVDLASVAGAANKFTFYMPEENVTVTVVFEKKDYTIVHSLENIRCDMDGEHSHTVKYDNKPTITLTPGAGFDLPQTLKVYTKASVDANPNAPVEFNGYTYRVNEDGTATLTFSRGIAQDVVVSGAGVPKTYTVVYALTNGVTAPGAPQTATHSKELSVTLTAARGYTLPEEITVTMAGEELTVDEDYTYDAGTGAVTIESVTGNVVITAQGEAEDVPLRAVTLVGPARVGRTLTVNVEPALATVDYQWVLVDEDGRETDIDGATGESYVIPADAESKTVKVRVKGKDGYAGELTSAPTETILAATEPFVFVTGIELSAQEAEVAVGKKITLTATVTPDNATAPTLAWSSDNEAIATVKDGVVTGVAEGTVTITAASTDTVNSVKATCQVTVTKAETPVTPSKPSSSGSTTTTETKEDGTKVTTETKPDGTKVETVEEPDGTKAVTETKPDGSKTATVEQPDGTKSETVVTPEGDATITVTDPEGEELAKVEIPAEIPAPETSFVDIDQTPWAEASINKVAGLELVKGIGGNKYDPVTPMTRGALATVLHRLSNGKTDYKVAFKDVAQGRYYTEGVAWAAKANVVKGISEDIFAPDQIITREQLATMLCRYAKLIGMDTKADSKALDTFVDGEDTGSWAVNGVAWCVEKGILKGKGANTLDPTADVSRAEVAVMLDRFIALIQK